MLTTASISCLTSPATRRPITFTGGCLSRSTRGLWTMNGGWRIPREAIVCATDAISSGLAMTPPWPIPATPRERSDGICSGFRVVLSGRG